MFNADIYQPLETAEQDWINSSFGEFVDNSLNTLYQDLGGQGILIGDGANGVGGGSLLAADGQAGGLLFGDGGNGATDLLGQGGAGGAAYDGDGGDGGVGTDGGSGGDGGNTAFGIAGNGGNAIGVAGTGADGGERRRRRQRNRGLVRHRRPGWQRR